MGKNNPLSGSGRRKEYSFEIVDRCEGLYVNDGKTLEAIATETGVSISQVQRWAGKYEWKRKKEDFKTRSMKAQEESRAIMREEILLQDQIKLKNTMDEYFKDRPYDKGDSATVANYMGVLNSIARLLEDIRKRDESLRVAQKIDRPQIFLDFLRDLVLFLKGRDLDALTALEKNLDEFATFIRTKYGEK